MATGSSHDIPVELWHEILSHLLLPDRKRFRLVSQEFGRIAKPFCFETVWFELSEDSISRVVQIAESKELAGHVRKLILRRRRGLREFSGFDAWERGLALPDDPETDSLFYDDYKNDDDEGLLSSQEWANLLYREKVALYGEYVADCEKMRKLARISIAHLRFHTLGSAQGERVHPERCTEEATLLEQFDESIKRFTNLNTFDHEPGFVYDGGWGTRWRNLRIGFTDILLRTFEEEDQDIEALQLSVVLSTLGWAKQFHPKLRSISFYALGPAFWTPKRLRRLWQGRGHEMTRFYRRLIDNAEDADKHIYSEVTSLQRDPYVRQTAIMEHALVHLTHFDCSISEEEANGGLFIASRPLFDFLRIAENLERLRLVFGRLEHGKLQNGYETRNHGDGPSKLLGLLSINRPWPRMRELELQIVTNEDKLLDFLVSLTPTLRRLILSNLTLEPGRGTWESALPKIVDRLDLAALELSRLCDYGPQERKIFQRGAKILHATELGTFNPAVFLQEGYKDCDEVN